MHFIDLAAQYQHLKTGIDKRIQAVLDHGQYIMGPEVQELEEKLAEYVGVKHAITCANGTDALTLALMALEIITGLYLNLGLALTYQRKKWLMLLNLAIFV